MKYRNKVSSRVLVLSMIALGGGSLFLLSKPSNAQVVYQCKACPAGSYSSSKTGYKCKKCEKGTYSSSVASTSCSKCPIGQYTYREGQILCEPCPVGTYYKNGDCVFCPSGTYSKKGTTKCKNMPLVPVKDFHCNYSGYCTFTNFFQIDDEQIVDLLTDFEKNFDNNSKWNEVNVSGTKHTLSRGLYKIINEEYNLYITFILVEKEATIRFSNDRKFEGINEVVIFQNNYTFKKLYKYKF